MTINKNIVITILILVIGILFYFLQKEINKNTENSQLISSLNSEMIQWKDKYGNSHSKIEILQTSSIKSFLEIQSKDSTILHLQQVVKTFKKEMARLQNVTHIDSETSAETLVKTDTIYLDKDSSPIYKSKFNLDNWVYGNVVSGKDSISLSLKVRNKFDVVIGEEKKNIFSRGKPFVEVVSKNPYTEVKTLRTYQVTMPKEKRWSFGPSISYGITEELQPKAVIGVSLQYGILKF